MKIKASNLPVVDWGWGREIEKDRSKVRGSVSVLCWTPHGSAACQAARIIIINSASTAGRHTARLLPAVREGPPSLEEESSELKESAVAWNATGCHSFAPLDRILPARVSQDAVARWYAITRIRSILGRYALAVSCHGSFN